MLDFNNIKFDNFFFNGDWLSSYGGKIGGRNGLEPFSILPTLEIKTSTVTNRDGSLVTGANYQPRVFSLPILFNNIQNIRSIASWLNVKQPTDFYFKDDSVKLKCMIDGVLNLEHYCLQGTIDLKFIAHDPFFTKIQENVLVFTSNFNSISVQNMGNVESYPLIKIYGTGDFTVTVNDSQFTISQIIDSFTVDSQYFTVYSGDIINDPSNAKNLLYAFNGKFPIFKTGINNISVATTGGCTKVEITPRTRWI